GVSPLSSAAALTGNMRPDCTGFVQYRLVRMANGHLRRLGPHPDPECPMKRPTPRSTVRALAVALSLGLAAPLAIPGQAGAHQPHCPPRAWADFGHGALAAGQSTSLAAALQAADLVATRKGEGSFTVFAPTAAAFAALPAGTVESLLKPENRDQLIAVLTY